MYPGLIEIIMLEKGSEVITCVGKQTPDNCGHTLKRLFDKYELLFRFRPQRKCIPTM